MLLQILELVEMLLLLPPQPRKAVAVPKDLAPSHQRFHLEEAEADHLLVLRKKRNVKLTEQRDQHQGRSWADPRRQQRRARSKVGSSSIQQVLCMDGKCQNRHHGGDSASVLKGSHNTCYSFTHALATLVCTLYCTHTP